MKRIRLLAVLIFAMVVIPTQTSAESMTYYYDSNSRVERVCMQYADCKLYSYDSNGNLLSKGSTRSISLPNPSFENGLSDIGYYVGAGSIDLDSMSNFDGTKSVKVTTSLSNESWVFQTKNFGKSITGRKFTVSAYVKTSELVGGVRILIYWSNGATWVWSNVVGSELINGDSDWTKITATAIAPYGATTVTPMIAAHSGQGSYWVDQMEVVVLIAAVKSS